MVLTKQQDDWCAHTAYVDFAIMYIRHPDMVCKEVLAPAYLSAHVRPHICARRIQEIYSYESSLRCDIQHATYGYPIAGYGQYK